MDAIFMSAEKSVYPNKQVKNIPWRNNSCGANLISNPNGNLAHRSFIHGGDLLFTAPFSHPLMHQMNYQQQQPPLLPLPATTPYRTRNKDQSVTPKRSKSKKLQLATKTHKPFVMASAKTSGSHPSPEVAKHLDSLSSSIFTLSPPPSSLPLPSFSLRPKHSCNTQAASFDDGAATHNIRRLLHLL